MYSVMLYVNATCVLLLLGFEFLALINVLIYVGALAVLFLFVIMLLEVPTTELRAYYRGYSIIGLISNVLIVGMYNMRHLNGLSKGVQMGNSAQLTQYDLISFSATQESIMQIGYAFYIQYADVLILNSLVLTIALFGALVLAHTRS